MRLKGLSYDVRRVLGLNRRAVFDPKSSQRPTPNAWASAIRTS
jgi:hypothetical protein